MKANLVVATRRLAEANLACDPYRSGLQAAENTLRAAREKWWSANNREHQSAKGRHHRAAHREVEQAKGVLDGALAEQQRAEAIAQPVTSRRDAAAAELRSIEITIRPTQQLIAMSDHAGRAAWLRDLDQALGDWQQWANGRTVPEARLQHARSILEEHSTPENPAWVALAAVLPAPPTINIAPSPLTRPHTPERDIGIGIA